MSVLSLVMPNKLMLSAIACIGLVGCAEQLNEEDSRVAFTVVSATLEAGAAAAPASGSAAYTGPSLAFREDVDAAVDYDFACVGGGKAHFSGTVLVSSEPDNDQVAVDLSTDFNGCKAEVGDITIDGGMDYSVSVSAAGDSNDVTVTMDGKLSFSGDINGACDIDVKLSVSSTPDSSSVVYSGSICGHDAEVTVNG